jgi:sigma-E factor negative regulatory protein RseA
MPSKHITPEQLNESVSALMDGEASELELRRILKSTDSEIFQRWHRYQIVSAALKGELQVSKPVDFSASIAAALEQEATHSIKFPLSNTKPRINLWSNIGRFAVAASVAGALVVGVKFAPTGSSTNFANAPAAQVVPLSPDPILDPGTAVRVVSQDGKVITPPQQQIIINKATQEQLQYMGGEVSRLMLEHAQNATQNTQQGVLPYVRVPDAEQ